jgi:hypothetical protein
MALNKEPRQVKQELLSPRVHVLYASSISGLRGVADRNMILHNFEKQVKFVKSYDGDTRVCIVGDKFDNADKMQIFDGTLFVVSNPMNASESGVYLLVFPAPGGDVSDIKKLNTNIARELNIRETEAMLDTEAEWVPVSFWKEMGDEGRGRIKVMPPSSKVTLFTATEQKYTPVPGMNEYLERGQANLWGELAMDTQHPSYKRMAEMR